MKKKPNPLSMDPQVLQEMVLALQSKVTDLELKNQHLLEQFRLAQQKRFGRSSEAHPAQDDLFNEAEAEFEKIEPKTQEISYTRNKAVRQKLPADLPREIITHDLTESEKTCDCCGEHMHKMGEERSEKLEFIPAVVKVIEHVRPKYGCRQCEKQSTEVKIKIAPVPPSIIPRSIATPSLLAQIITSKYQYSLPLYRQESLFKQYGINLSRQTMSDWMIKCSTLFKPLYDYLRLQLLKQPVIYADETTLKVIQENRSKCYMWVYCSGADSRGDSVISNIVLYDYNKGSRSSQAVIDYLDGYDGYLQVDGYPGYNKVDATLVGCWAHVRRPFKEAKAKQPQGGIGKADWALNQIQKLYRIETAIKHCTPDEKYRVRQNKSVPLLDEFKKWLDKSAIHTPPTTAVGKPIHYALNQWEKLIRYVKNGHLDIDNNRAERAVKPFVIGRKNWMFSNTGNGAQASAVLYSIVETAKANGLVPYDYIRHCLEHLIHEPDNLDAIVPWNVKLD
ncbi:IS66 family transposase [Pseudoalteromonas sp. NBT06-2]|uniref:IS66 family transposase n=1 Tax=Pseudoalteromonas sp. NBT06-2 TaxID=2025950 RepID=UPI001140B190|nr:IS66 family transposase [Pseudoalteromonas sp. NBT06-2]